MARTKTTTGSNTIRLGRRFSSPDGWIGRHPRDVWPELGRTDPTGFTLRRWMNPLRPLPPLSIVFIFNPSSSTAARSLATKFANDFPAYAHLHIPDYLCNLRDQMQLAVSEKLLGDLHPSAFISFIDKNTYPPNHFLIDIIKRAFEVDGRRNPTKPRKWVITGLLAQWNLVAKFRHVICEPMATIFFTPPGAHPNQSMVELYYDFVDRGARPFWLEDDEEESYARLLWAITDHAVRGGLLVSSEVTSDEPQPGFAEGSMMEIDTQTGPEATGPSEAALNGQDADDTVERVTDMDLRRAGGRDTPMEEK